jgi:hypothetical protein
MWKFEHREKDTDELSTFIYIPNIFSRETSHTLREWLDEQYHDFHGGTTSFGKSIPRKQRWFQENGKYFCESWKLRLPRWEASLYSPYLKEIQTLVYSKFSELSLDYSTIQNPKLNSCLVNLYRDGNDSIKPHRDSPISFGFKPTIIGISLGETRTMNIQHIHFDDENIQSLKPNRDDNVSFTLQLHDNSMFIMAGASQKYFTHEIVKDNSVKKRYSLTFRQFIG